MAAACGVMHGGEGFGSVGGATDAGHAWPRWRGGRRAPSQLLTHGDDGNALRTDAMRRPDARRRDVGDHLQALKIQSSTDCTFGT